MQRCVDQNNNVVPDSLCKDSNQSSNGHPPYRYYYGGSGGYTTGTHAEGGSFTPSAGRSYASGTTRGGFGSSFGGEGGGE